MTLFSGAESSADLTEKYDIFIKNKINCIQGVFGKHCKSLRRTACCFTHKLVFVTLQKKKVYVTKVLIQIFHGFIWEHGLNHIRPYRCRRHLQLRCPKPQVLCQ